MGGLRGEVKGVSKSETYQRYVEDAQKYQHMLPDQYPDPAHKKFCKDQMVQDPQTGEWVLHYRLQK